MIQKFTFLVAVLGTIFLAFAQQTSFETSQGYNAGESINGIKGWQDVSENSNYFYVTNEKASEGENSLKWVYSPSQPLILAHWIFENALPVQDNLEISMDVFVPGDMTTFYWKIMSNNQYAAFIIVQESYVFPAKVTVVNPVPIAMAPLNVGEFNEIKLIFNYTNHTITYFANGVEIHQSGFWGASGAIDKYAFEGFLQQNTYMDNLKTNASFGVNNYAGFSIAHYVQDNSLHLQSSVPMDAIEVYDTTGKLVLSQSLRNSRESISISQLNAGVHFARLKLNNKLHTFKFIKR